MLLQGAGSLQAGEQLRHPPAGPTALLTTCGDSSKGSQFHCNTPHLYLTHAFLTFGFLQLDLDLGGHDLVGALEGQHRVGQVELQAE